MSKGLLKMDSLPTIPKPEPGENNSSLDEDNDPFFGCTAGHETDVTDDYLNIDKFEIDNNEDELEVADAFVKEEIEKLRKSSEKRKKIKTPSKTVVKPSIKPKPRLRVRYPCSECSKIFYHVRLFKDHLETHDPDRKSEGNHKCPHSDCSREFSSQTGLKNHLNYHITNSESLLQKCCHCEDDFDSIEKLNIHLIESHGVSLKTEGGLVGNSYISFLDQQKRNMKRKKWHTCKTCGKRLGNVTVYKKHILTHQDSKRQQADVTTSCRVCHREFYSEHGLRVHIRNSACKSAGSEVSLLDEEIGNEGEKKSLKCPDCPRQFSEVLKLDIHLVSVHQKESVCSQCGKKFPNGARLFRHHNVHKLPSFKCPQDGCMVAFRTKEALVVHRRKHDGILPYICKVCQEGFQTKQQLILHRIEVHGQKIKPITSVSKKPGTSPHSKRKNNNGAATFPCPKPDCDSVFKYEKSLIIHQRKHEGLLPYLCRTCQQAFSMKQDLIQHRIEFHKEKLKALGSGQIFQCETCGSTFKNPYTLNNHVKREHSELKNFECKLCGKKFSLEYDFKVHKSYHAGAGLFICEECGKSFNSKSDLVRHSMSHKPDAEKPFQCHICAKGFVRKIHFVEHCKLHSGEKTEKVKRFKPKYSEKTKVEQVEIACQFCDKPMPTKDALRSHLRRVHGRDSHGNDVGKPTPKLYNCPLCSKVFHKKVRLVDHHKDIHGLDYEEIKPQKKLQEKPKSQLPRNRINNNNNEGNGELPLQLPLVNIRYPLWDGHHHQNFNNSNMYNTTLIPLSQQQPLFTQAFENQCRMITTDCVAAVASSAHLLGSASTSAINFHNHQLNRQPESNAYLQLERTITNDPAITLNNYVQPPISTVDQLSNATSNNAQVIDSAINISQKSSNPMAVEAKQYSSNTVTTSHHETVPSSSNWESTFGPEMELDDYFDRGSPEPFLDDTPNGGGLATTIKTEAVETLEFKYIKVDRLSERDLELIKTYIGSRAFSLPLERLKTFPCKLCKVEFHRKDLHGKHCRSVRHWQAIRRIKKGTSSEKISGENNSDDDELDLKRRCSICGLRFNTLKIVVLHCKSEHPGQKAFTCDLCGTSYFNFKHLRHHKVTFHKDGDFVCVVCKEKFPSYEIYRKHIKTAHKDAERKCQLCEESFNTLKKLTDHCESAHAGQKPFSCDICGTAYLRFKDYRHHRSRFHIEDDPNIDDPSKVRKPGIGRRKYPRIVCKICGKSFGNMKAHMALHNGEKPHLCDLCGKSFGKKCNLEMHKKRHLGLTRFPCTECPKQFYRKRDLRLHSAVHNKSYSCAECQLKFSSHELLNKHLALHDPSRPFRCSICGLMFNFRGNLATHIRKIHPDFTHLLVGLRREYEQQIPHILQANQY